LGYERQPTLIYQQMAFAAELAAISRVSVSMLAISRCWHAGSVNAGSIPHDLVVLTGPPQDGLVAALLAATAQNLRRMAKKLLSPRLNMQPVMS
jgi:hypothetical protein